MKEPRKARLRAQVERAFEEELDIYMEEWEAMLSQHLGTERGDPMNREPTLTAPLFLTPADQGRPLTFDEFQQAGSLEGYHYELIDGKVEVSPQANLPHNRLAKWLGERLSRYARRCPQVINEVLWPACVFV